MRRNRVLIPVLLLVGTVCTAALVAFVRTEIRQLRRDAEEDQRSAVVAAALPLSLALSAVQQLGNSTTVLLTEDEPESAIHRVGRLISETKGTDIHGVSLWIDAHGKRRHVRVAYEAGGLKVTELPADEPPDWVRRALAGGATGQAFIPPSPQHRARFVRGTRSGNDEAAVLVEAGLGEAAASLRATEDELAWLAGPDGQPFPENVVLPRTREPDEQALGRARKARWRETAVPIVTGGLETGWSAHLASSEDSLYRASRRLRELSWLFVITVWLTLSALLLVLRHATRD